MIKETKKIAVILLCGICLFFTTAMAEFNDFKKLADAEKGNLTMSPYKYVQRSEMNIPIKITGQKYDLLKDFKATNVGFKDVSKVMQQAIDKINSKGGGTLYIPKGKYGLCNVVLKSNVHILIASSTSFKGLSKLAKGKSYSFFNLGSDKLCENVSIKCEKGKYNVLIPNYKPGVRFVNLKTVRHFLIADARIYDHKTKFSCITLGATEKNSTNIKDNFIGPTDGVITDITLYGGDYGYGVIQAQAAKNVRFYNLYGQGGVTLRLETGYTRMNNEQWGGVFDILAKNIMNVRGNAALMVSPHAMHCGVVNISDVTAVSSGFAARIDNGFISKKYEKRSDITIGDFKGGSLKNVTCYYGEKAQLKTKHLGYVPRELISKVSKPDESSVCEPAPSACAILFEPNYPFDLDRSSVKAIGFKYSQAVMTKPYKLSNKEKE